MSYAHYEHLRDEADEAARSHEPEAVRCVCGVMLNKDDAVRAEDSESWLCQDCAEWIAAMNAGRVA